MKKQLKYIGVLILCGCSLDNDHSLDDSGLKSDPKILQDDAALAPRQLLGSNKTKEILLSQVVYDHVGKPFRNGDFSAPWGAHEGRLHGVPERYNWAAGARPAMWINSEKRKFVTSWGQIYEDAQGSPEKNIRIQARKHTLYVYAAGSWTILEQDSENLQAHHFTEDFKSMDENPCESRVEPENEGGVSWTPKVNHNIHWWTTKWPRAAIPTGAEAYFITVDLRLIPNSDKNVDLDNAKYLAGVSADYYNEANEHGVGPFPSLSITRHKYIKKEWQSFNAYIGGRLPTSVEDYREEIFSRPLPPSVFADP
jgi:hypothetical protein